MLDKVTLESVIAQHSQISNNFLAELEDEANQPQEKRMRVSEPEARYAIYMMEKYGDDYKVGTVINKRMTEF